MNSSYEIFVLVVEEMSFTKAARRAYLTQQCISDHIKRLEKQYEILLFERRPRLKLTAAGETMYASLLQINNMKNNMENRIKEISRGAMGQLTVGINTSRARVIMPSLFNDYHKKYPYVSVSIFSDDTPNMGQMLIKGKLDMFVAVDITSNELFKISPITNDEVFLIISDMLFDKTFQNTSMSSNDFLSKGVDLALFESVPFVRNYPTSTINQLIDRHINKHNFNLQTIFRISDYGTQLMLCASHLVAAFVPSLALRPIIQHNMRVCREQRINIFPINNLQETLRVDCVRLKKSYLPQYAYDFMKDMKNMILQEKDWCLQNRLKYMFE